MSWNKLEKSRRTIIIVSALCLAVGFVLFAMRMSMPSLIAFTLAAVLPLWAIGGRTGTGQNGKPEIEDDMITALEGRLEGYKMEINDFNSTIKSKDKEISDLNILLEHEKKNLAEATAKANQAIAEAETAKDALKTSRKSGVSLDDTASMAGILPQAEGDDGKKQVLDITTVIKSAADDFRAAAAEAGVVINIVDPAEPMYVSAAPVMLRTMFRDIIDNAVKYMKQSGALQITIANLDEDIFIAMKDNGKGLNESETVHIFELNFQGSNRVSGNGLGLAQAKAIVDYYGGMIYAKSSPGRGMGIYLHFPAVRK